MCAYVQSFITAKHNTLLFFNSYQPMIISHQPLLVTQYTISLDHLPVSQIKSRREVSKLKILIECCNNLKAS